MKHRRLALLIIFIAWLISEISLAATTGKISGTVRDDENDEPLIGANVILAGTSLGAATDANGDFFIINVPPGTYDVTVQMIGYSALTIEALAVSVGRTSQISVNLKTTVIEGETIYVSADRVSTKKDQTGSIRNVSSEDLALLPIESVGQAINMQAGVVNGHFRGGRSGEVSYMIDGMQIDNALDRGQSVELNVNAVQDMEVITGTFNAEYGKAMSGVVNLITKDGGDQLRGSVSGYFGNYFTSHDNEFPNLPPADVARNQDYRIFLEGPLKKGLLYFFP